MGEAEGRRGGPRANDWMRKASLFGGVRKHEVGSVARDSDRLRTTHPLFPEEWPLMIYLFFLFFCSLYITFFGFLFLFYVILFSELFQGLFVLYLY